MVRAVSCLIIIILVVCGIAGFVGYSQYNDNANSVNYSYTGEEKFKIIEVKKGESLNDIMTKLDEAKLINNLFYFKIYAKLNPFTVQAGSYNIPTNTNFKGMVEALSKPILTEFRVSFPEGLRADEISSRISTQVLEKYNSLKEEGLWAGGELRFVQSEFDDIVKNPHNYNLNENVLDLIPEGYSLEGFLFPDTYVFAADVTAEKMISTFLDHFYKKFEEAKGDIDSDYRGTDLGDYQKIILASIVEKESPGDLETREKIADVFYKRLSGDFGIDGRLQSDVTLLYYYGDWKAPIYANDMQNPNNKYSTHANRGVPPTPISNMGFTALKATYHPTENPYMFFIADRDGVVRFAATFAEHNENIRKYGLAGE